MRALGDRMSSAIREKTSASYRSIVGADWYITTGSHDDWFYDKANMLGFTIEMGDSGRYGFLLPGEQIRSAGMELTEAVLQAAEMAVEDNFGCPG